MASAWPPVPTNGSDGYSLFGGSGMFGGSAPPPAAEGSSPKASAGLPPTPAAAADQGANARGPAKKNPWAGPGQGNGKGRSTSPVFSDMRSPSSSEEEPEQAALRQQAKLAAAARANGELNARDAQALSGLQGDNGGLSAEEIQALQQQVSTLRNEKLQLEMMLEEKPAGEEKPLPGQGQAQPQPKQAQAPAQPAPAPQPEPQQASDVTDTFHTGPVNKSGQQQSWRNRQNSEEAHRQRGRGGRNERGEGPVVQLRSGPDDDFRLDRPRGARMTEKWQKRWSTGSWGDRPYMIKARHGSYPSGPAFAESVVLNAAGAERSRIHQTYSNLFVGCAAAVTTAQLAVLRVHPDVEYVRTASCS